MNTYTWDFLKFNAHANLNGREKVIFNIEFVLNGSDGEGHGAQVFGTVGLKEPTDAFVTFEELIPEQVVEMVETALGDDLLEYKRMLDSKIQEQIVPTVLELGTPWPVAATDKTIVG
jgi:hypothetical protein